MLVFSVIGLYVAVKAAVEIYIFVQTRIFQQKAKKQFTNVVVVGESNIAFEHVRFAVLSLSKVVWVGENFKQMQQFVKEIKGQQLVKIIHADFKIAREEGFYNDLQNKIQDDIAELVIIASILIPSNVESPGDISNESILNTMSYNVHLPLTIIHLFCRRAQSTTTPPTFLVYTSDKLDKQIPLYSCQANMMRRIVEGMWGNRRDGIEFISVVPQDNIKNHLGYETETYSSNDIKTTLNAIGNGYKIETGIGILQMTVRMIFKALHGGVNKWVL